MRFFLTFILLFTVLFFPGLDLDLSYLSLHYCISGLNSPLVSFLPTSRIPIEHPLV